MSTNEESENEFTSSLSSVMVVGSRVLIKSNLHELELMNKQENCGGFMKIMTKLLGNTGIIIEVVDEKTYAVKCAIPKQCFHWSKDLLLLLPGGNDCIVGSQVKILPVDISTATDLQKEHGGFNSDMAVCLGERGMVMKIDNDGDYHIAVKGRVHCWAPELIQPLIESASAEDVQAFIEANNSKPTPEMNDHGEENTKFSPNKSGSVKEELVVKNQLIEASIRSLMNINEGEGDVVVSIRFIRKLLLNIIDHPDVAKFTIINTRSKVFEDKLPTAILVQKAIDVFLSLGFTPRDNDVFKLEYLQPDRVILQKTIEKLYQAENGYSGPVFAVTTRPAGTGRNMPHTGEFRRITREHDKFVTYCAMDESQKHGSSYLCEHNEDVILVDHWSCCGNRFESSMECLTRKQQDILKNDVVFNIGDEVRIRKISVEEAMRIHEISKIPFRAIMKNMLGSVGVVASTLFEDRVIEVNMGGIDIHWHPSLVTHFLTNDSDFMTPLLDISYGYSDFVFQTPIDEEDRQLHSGK